MSLSMAALTEDILLVFYKYGRSKLRKLRVGGFEMEVFLKGWRRVVLRNVYKDKLS